MIYLFLTTIEILELETLKSWNRTTTNKLNTFNEMKVTNIILVSLRVQI